MDENESIEIESLFIPMEDGTEMECAVLDRFDAIGRSYIVVGPIVNDELTDDEYLYRCEEDGEDLIINSVEDNDELDAVYEVYRKLIEAEEG